MNSEQEIISQSIEVWNHLVQYGSISMDRRKSDERLVKYMADRAVVAELEEWNTLEGYTIVQKGDTIYRVPNPDCPDCLRAVAGPCDAMENLISYIVLFALNELMGGTGTDPMIAEFLKIEDLQERLTRFFSVVSSEDPDCLEESPYSRTIWDMATLWMGKPMVDETRPDSTAKDTQRGIINKAITSVRAYGIFNEDRQYRTISPSQKTKDLLPLIFSVSRKKEIQKKMKELTSQHRVGNAEQEV